MIFMVNPNIMESLPWCFSLSKMSKINLGGRQTFQTYRRAVSPMIAKQFWPSFCTTHTYVKTPPNGKMGPQMAASWSCWKPAITYIPVLILTRHGVPREHHEQRWPCPLDSHLAWEKTNMKNNEPAKNRKRFSNSFFDGQLFFMLVFSHAKWESSANVKKPTWKTNTF